MVAEGYQKHYGNVFKVSTMARWMVILSGPQMLEDIRRATDEQLSLKDTVLKTLQTDYTIGVHTRLDPYHIKVVRSPLTHWVTVTACDASREVVCRSSNRLFVGLPLCRDPDYRSLNEHFSMEVITQAQLINLFPSFMKPIVGRLISKNKSNLRRVVSHVGQILHDRLEMLNHNDRENEINQPNDLISWLLEEAKGPQRTIDDLPARILNINFASIHSTSMGLTSILFDLCMYPEYIEPMREEVSAIVKAEGWTKSSLAKMRKVDSFVKESQRLNTSSCMCLEYSVLMDRKNTNGYEVSAMRKALKDFTFSNGVTVPAGTYIAFAALPTHLDERNYDNAKEFQGFRFIDIRDEEAEGTKHQIVSINSEFLIFGTGRHAWTSRNSVERLSVYQNAKSD
ncbi:Cytochrome P450 monooxygenase 103 [Psilocybe cubensis]|uniref:Cytochrome P450 monooxygenase 103 n=1 Tax=Psilocybe cubensis TaxID=181762 RepID=A0ACB8GPG7_PSICU|nr:Cytochrome P450 monooxygenase 103 [Psilocybe cubensis]KAH9477625.1 Cytochrome P450 monooxygenase 103 [Psilocybe cubensis]